MDAKDTFSSRGNAGGQAHSGPTAQDKQGMACRTEVRAGSDRVPPTHLGLAGAGLAESAFGNEVLVHRGLEEMTQQERLGKTKSGTRRRRVGLASD